MADEGMYFNCTALFKEAEAAMLRIPASAGDREPRQQDALTSVVLAAASLEGFINEALEVAEFPEGDEPSATKMIAAWIGVMVELEAARASLQSKYLMTKWIFSSEPFNKGGQPYQDFDLLLDLRNSIMHLKAVDRFRQIDGVSERVKPLSIIERLRSRNILGESIAVPPLTFIDLICTRAVARWACTSAISMVTTIIEVAPPSALKSSLVHIGRWFHMRRDSNISE